MKLFDPKLTGSIEIQDEIKSDITISGSLDIKNNLTVTGSLTLPEVISASGDIITINQGRLGKITTAELLTNIGAQPTGSYALVSQLHDILTLGENQNGLSLSGQVLSLALASTNTNGALSSTDWNTFNNKYNQPAGTTLQYIRGDGSLATLNTTAVPEGTNLYFTNARARQSVSLTTSGTSGASTYNNSTGVFNIPNYTLAGLGGQPISEKGQINGYASLDGSGKVPAGQLPSYVDDVLEFNNLASFPTTGETGKIYVALDNNKAYRWSGSIYVEVSPSDVNSVFGRTGIVTAQSGDYNTSQVTENTNLYFTNARARAALSFVAGSGAYNSTTGVITIPTNTNQLTNGAGFITGNQTITLSGVVTGSGTTAITTSIANGAISNAMLANSSFHVGTTLISLGRASAGQTLTGVSIDGNSGTTTQRNFSGDISTGGQGRFTGWYTGNAATGIAAEIGMSAGQGYVFVYNRQTSSYGILNIASNGANLQFNGSSINATSGALQQGGNQVLHAGNFNSYAPTLTGTGASGTWGINITGNAATATTASNSNLLNGISSTQIFNNMGQTHSTNQDFNAITDFGVRYLQGPANGPSTGSSQYYGFTLGLGSDYPLNGAGSYASQFYWGRTPLENSSPYISVRFKENNVWGSWSKIFAGYADSAGSVDFNALTNKTGGTGTYQTSGDFRAPIFYDSNDTFYQLDPNGNSRLFNLGLGGVTPDARLSVGGDTHISGYLYQGGTAGVINSWGSRTLVSGGNYVANALSFRFDNVGYGSTWALDINSGGNVIASVDMRAPIFYDSNNTAFYLDPASTSRVNLIQSDNYIFSNTSFNPAANPRTTTNPMSIKLWNNYFNGIGLGVDYGTVLEYYSLDGHVDTQVYFDAGGGSWYRSSSYLSGWQSWQRYITDANYSSYALPLTGGTMNGVISLNDASYFRGSPTFGFRFNNSADTINALIVNNSGNVTAHADFRAPVFYDSNNTTYYADPNGISNMYGIAIRGDQSQFDTSNQIFFWGGGNTTTSAIGFKNSGGNFQNPTGSGDGYNTYLTMDTPGRGWVFREGIGGANFGAAYTSGWILNNGNWQSNASMRSPIFYDSNNTSFYLDPSSTSYSSFNAGGARFRNIDISNASLTDTIQNVNTGGNIWLNYGHNGPVGLGFGGGLTTAYSGLAVNGTASATGDFRAPIFYDSNNTGFYLDPASTSVLNSVNINTLNGHALNADNYLGRYGNSYYQVQTWLQSNGTHGIYWPSWYGAHFYINNGSSFTQFRLDGQKNGYGGIWDSYSAVAGIMYDGAGNGGIYREANGRWYIYHNLANNCLGIGTSSTSPMYGIYLDKGGRFGDRVDATVFFDTNNTAYYVDPSATGDSIRVAGDIVAYFSDERLKNIKGNIDNPLEKISKLNGFYYEPNDIAQSFGYKKELQIGLSAQEVESILPELIKDAPIGHGYKTVDYSKLVPLLVEAIKEQQKQIEELKTLIK